MTERDSSSSIRLCKSTEIPQTLYPDVHLAGGLVRFVEQWFEGVEPAPEVSGLPGGGEPAYARVDVHERFSQVYVAHRPRLFCVDFWASGVCFANATFDDHQIAAQAICLWTRQRVWTQELVSHFPNVIVHSSASVFEEGREVEEAWKSCLEKPPRPQLAAVIRAAAAHHELRRLFPFTSMWFLCFSRCTGYPYTADCPTIAPTPNGQYAVLLRDGTTSPEVGAEEAVRLVIANLPPGCGPAIRGTAKDVPS